jgi:hypothetical protein
MMRTDDQPRASLSGYEQAFQRIRAEYLEMPGMRLTAAQVERLSGVETSVCKRVLNDLVRTKFLRVSSDGTFVRSNDDSPSTSRVGNSQGNSHPVHPAARRAS